MYTWRQRRDRSGPRLGYPRELNLQRNFSSESFDISERPITKRSSAPPLCLSLKVQGGCLAVHKRMRRVISVDNNEW